jgi:hypothetical protein
MYTTIAAAALQLAAGSSQEQLLVLISFLSLLLLLLLLLLLFLFFWRELEQLCANREMCDGGCPDAHSDIRNGYVLRQHLHTWDNHNNITQQPYILHPSRRSPLLPTSTDWPCS